MEAVRAEREKRSQDEERRAQAELECELKTEQERLNALQQEVNAVQSLMGVCFLDIHNLFPLSFFSLFLFLSFSFPFFLSSLPHSGKLATRTRQQGARLTTRGADGGNALEITQLPKAHARGALRDELQVVHEVRYAGTRCGGSGRNGRGNHCLHPCAASPLSPCSSSSSNDNSNSNSSSALFCCFDLAATKPIRGEFQQQCI